MTRNWKRKCPILNIILDVLSKLYLLATLDPILRFDMFQTKHIMVFFKKNLQYIVCNYIILAINTCTNLFCYLYQLQINIQFPSFLEVYICLEFE